MDDSLANYLLCSKKTPAAFAGFYRAFSGKVLSFTLLRVADPEVALDLVAESFAKAYMGRARFRGSSDAEAEAWILSIARNEIRQYFRRAAVERKAVGALGIQVPTISDDDLARIEQLTDLDRVRERIRGLVGSLSTDQQAALEARVIDGLRYAEVATLLGISEQAARARVARALGALQRAIAEDESLQEVLQ